MAASLARWETVRSALSWPPTQQRYTRTDKSSTAVLAASWFSVQQRHDVPGWSITAASWSPRRNSLTCKRFSHTIKGKMAWKIKLAGSCLVLDAQLGPRKLLGRGLCECGGTTPTSPDKQAGLSRTKALIFFSKSRKRPLAHALKCISPVWFGASKTTRLPLTMQRCNSTPLPFLNLEW